MRFDRGLSGQGNRKRPTLRWELVPGNPGSPSIWGERKMVERGEASVAPSRPDRMTARLKAKAHGLNERVTPVCKLPLPPANPPGDVFGLIPQW